ncbi:hypothetical protein DY000_02059901 [Brassica cretica]|uniref:Uncharacterized protein n=1 Tax=Brassica cretica TaxID=69181 RepID=A0ABQ7B1T0_BRACR|nr:hypothetical protein DY000_02059901 [Brassica cretica]
MSIPLTSDEEIFVALVDEVNGGGNKRVFQRLGGSNYPKDSNQPEGLLPLASRPLQPLPLPFPSQRATRYSSIPRVIFHQQQQRVADDSGFSLLTQVLFLGHVVTGIALPSGYDKLYTASKDETLQIWDCASGQCTGVLNLGGEAGCMISEGPWLLVGMPNLVKSFDAYLYIQAWNIQTNVDLSLTGPVGQVYSLVVATDLLFAGTQVKFLAGLYSIFLRPSSTVLECHVSV